MELDLHVRLGASFCGTTMLWVHRKCLSFMVLALAVTFLHQECMALNTDGVALLEFKSWVEDDPRGVLLGWDNSERDPCSWDGVGCDVEGRVVMLDLKEMSLKGRLSPRLGSLSQLRVLMLANNKFIGTIPVEICQLKLLEVFNLRNNRLSGTIPLGMLQMQSLDRILLCSNYFQNVESWIGEATNTDIEIDLHQCNSGKQYRLPMYSVRRMMLEENNHASPYFIARPPSRFASVPSTGSGSLPAVTNTKENNNKNSPTRSPAMPHSEAPSFEVPEQAKNSSKKSLKWIYTILLPVIALLLLIAMCVFCGCHKKGVATIGPLRSGISGQLQKAFVTGVPHLNRKELESASEDFSNIVLTYPHFTVYKGTLSNGIEIAIVSTVISSAKYWSKHAEGQFRQRIATLSRINHKNFVNLLAYCEEEKPFTRMMVLEYAPNGSLYDHLHSDEFDRMHWTTRMRIVMGIAYCLQHLHEMNPPVAHPDLQSSSVLVSDDCAAKVVDASVWKELCTKRRNSAGNEQPEHSEPASPARDVYCFGIILLEIISGKLPLSDNEGSLVKLAWDVMGQHRSMHSLLDPTLKLHNAQELDIICQIIPECIQADPTRRPTMQDVTSRLGDILGLSPEAAAPRVNALWWAELEILSV